jgi:hypothetical protein
MSFSSLPRLVAVNLRFLNVGKKSVVKRRAGRLSLEREGLVFLVFACLAESKQMECNEEF